MAEAPGPRHFPWPRPAAVSLVNHERIDRLYGQAGYHPGRPAMVGRGAHMVSDGGFVSIVYCEPELFGFDAQARASDLWGGETGKAV